MGILKTIRWTYLFVSLIPVALGIVCIVNPGFIAGVICYVAGGLLLGFGLAKVIRYFASKSSFADSLVAGVLFSMLGFILIFRKDEVINLIFIFIGILVLLDGVVKLKNAIEARSLGSRDWIVLLIVSVIVMGFGVLMVADPFSGYVPIVILGISILLLGLQNVYAALRTVIPAARPGSLVNVEKNVTVDDYDVGEGE